MTKSKTKHDLIPKQSDDDAPSANKKTAPKEASAKDEDATQPSDPPSNTNEASPADDLDTDMIQGTLLPDPSPQQPPTWNSMLYSLLLFKARRGDMNVPYNDAYLPLHRWVQDQRNQYRQYQERGVAVSDDEGEGLTIDRIAVLDTVGFAWNMRGDVSWGKHYEALVEYKKEHGDVKVPRLYVSNPRLGEWVTDQRRQLKAKLDGRPTLMTDERKEKLDELGFLWKVRERADWNDRYEQLLEYKKENGDCVVPQHYAQNRALGKWVAKQREQYRFYHAGKHSFLTEERIDLLKSLDFVWRVKGKGKGDFDKDEMMDGDEVMGNAIKTEMEEEEKQEATAGPMKKRRKIPPKKAKKVNKPTTEDESSDLDDEDEDGYDDGEKVAATDEADGKPKASDDGASAIRTANFIPSMNGMGLLASVTDQMSGAIPNVAGVPALPTIPADQQLFFAEQQHAVRASMLENFAARANQQMEFAQQRAMANSQTMADIAAALARQSRFGNGFAGASGMGMFNPMNMPGVHVPNIPGDADPEENLRNLSRMI